ncbi:MAG TPA: hypothetical protein P5552_17965 [Candidatus Competibacteraceae bacterium]|nr:hypothetical protein [Candidatus Competibacteraceae bacterium]
MHSARSTYLKRALAVALILGPTLALVSAEVEARRGGGGRGGGVGGGHEIRAPRGNVGGGGRDINRGDYNRRDVNVNRDVNINRNVDVDVDRHWGYPVGAGAVAVGTAVAVGAIVSTLPSSCSTFVADGVTYQNCGGTYYAPRYDGPNVVYEVVSPPSSGFNNQ